MDFTSELVLPGTPDRIWGVLLDVRRIAACVPGCEDVEELAPHERYRALMKQRVGPFRLEMPVEIRLEEIRAGERIRARTTGRDRATGTAVTADLTLTLAPAGASETRLGIVTDLQISGRLASLGYPMIRKRADEHMAEFARRLRATLEAA